MRLSPFFPYYGSKHRASVRYPAPEHRTIVEPFAGSAAYSTRHHTHDVVLYDANPRVAAVWDYLIRGDVSELPGDGVESVDDMVGVPEEAKYLVGFWLKKSAVEPMKKRQGWSTDPQYAAWFWCAKKRDKLAHQQQFIRHWKVVCADYTTAPNDTSTWFVDPPYSGRAGRLYTHNDVDYAGLGDWCQSRYGQVIVCEHADATWLPFEPLYEQRSTRHSRKMEGVYVRRSGISGSS